VTPLSEPYGRVVVVGGAGFIGGHLVERLLRSTTTRRVVVYDNFTSGRDWHLDGVASDPRLEVIRADVSEQDQLEAAMSGCDTAIHLASNPDIARAMADPTVDFAQGTALTHAVAEAARRSGIALVLYASGSGVYGDLGELEADERHGPLEPVSTYGASKLAGEALLCAYSHMFGMRARAFRFGNVVGPRQTHGVAFDFIRKLLENPARLEILGDGTQSKSYIHVDDVADAVLSVGTLGDHAFDVFNVATGDYLTVNEIAELTIDCLGLDRGAVELVRSGGSRGWQGDVPIVRLSTEKIRRLGWSNRYGSREALAAAITSMYTDARAGRLW